MKRTLAALVALATIGALGFAPGPGPLAGSAQAGATDCVWQRHSKRIVKQVKRDGKPRRMVRTKHWWTCNPLVTLPATVTPPAPSPAPTPAPAPSSQPAPEPAPTVARLGVKSEEWSFTLSRPSVAAGEVIVELNNQGGDPHNLNLRREGDSGPPLEVSEAGPLEHRTGRFTLPAGTYQLWCSLPEHEEKGMRTTLIVSDGG